MILSLSGAHENYTTVKIAIVGYVNLILIAMMVPTFLMTAICASAEGIKRFEKFALPISAVLTLAHVIILIILQVYIFKVEKEIKHGILSSYDRMAKVI